MTAGIYRHPPGTLSRWGVLDVGLKCVHSCKHCFYSFMDGSDDQFAGMRRAGWHKPEHLFALVDSLADNGFIGFDITGGEPGAYPHIVEVIRHATERGIASRIITLGQFLGHRDLLARLLDAGLTEFRFSLHATEPEMFHAMTGGNLAKLTAAMDELQRIGFQYITNTTVTEKNYQALPDIARFIAARPEVYAATFLLFMPYYEWSKPGRTGGVRVRYSDAAEYLREAVAIVEESDIAATVRYAPQCTIRGMERNHVGIVGVRHDIHEWMNAIDHRADPAVTDLRSAKAMGLRLSLSRYEAGVPLVPMDGMVARRGGKVFPEKCRGCRAITVCDGVDPAYLEEHGDGELDPYTAFRGDVLDRERLAYLPGTIIKTRPDGDAKSAVRAAFQEMRANVAAAVAA